MSECCFCGKEKGSNNQCEYCLNFKFENEKYKEIVFDEKECRYFEPFGRLKEMKFYVLKR